MLSNKIGYNNEISRIHNEPYIKNFTSEVSLLSNKLDSYMRFLGKYIMLPIKILLLRFQVLSSKIIYNDHKFLCKCRIHTVQL